MFDDYKRGWYLAWNAHKYHYYDGQDMSLCRRWVLLAPKSASFLEDSQVDREDCCVSCYERRSKERSNALQVEGAPGLPDLDSSPKVAIKERVKRARGRVGA